MKILFLVPCFVLLLGVLMGQVGPPPAPEPIPVGSSLTWDHVALDAAGNPEIIDFYTIAVTPPEAIEPAQGVTLREVQVAETGGHVINFDVLLAGLPDGVYWFWGKAHDPAGNVGEWSLPLKLSKDRTPPARMVLASSTP